MINQVWLKTFCTLAEVGHFTRTAEKLFMTQSGVSQHIKKLEQQLDSQLLIREGKSFSLTSKGQQLYTKGYALLRSFEDLGKSIKQDEPLVGKVRIASPGSVGLSLYPHLLDFQQQHPNLIIDYMFAPNKTVVHSLLENQIDIGLTTELTEASHVRTKKIAEEALVLVTPARVNEIDWESLMALGFIAHPDAAHHGNLLLCANYPEFDHVDQFPHKGFSNQISLILDPVSKGIGFTVLPLHAAEAYHPQNAVKIHTLPNPVSESLYLCTSRRASLPSRVKLVMGLLSEYLI